MKDRIRVLESNIDFILWLYNYFKDEDYLKEAKQLEKELIQIKYIDTWI